VDHTFDGFLAVRAIRTEWLASRPLPRAASPDIFRSLASPIAVDAPLFTAISCVGGSHVARVLASLLFRGTDALKRIGDLSEGERVRVALAKLLASGANLLVLDEPTNHLDIATRERIEAAFEGYDGTMLLVSHDRYLLDRLSGSTLVLEQGRTPLYPGNYSYVREKRAMHDAN
jgi:ATPase subunit of ABC transporter with duplicated ATPase domains